MALSINERLCLVIPIYDDQVEDKVKAYIHATPLSREVFEANFIAQQLVGAEGDSNELVAPLQNEIRRLTNLLVVADGRWQMVPLEQAIAQRMLSIDDLSEVENALVYFIVCSAMHHRRLLANILPGAVKLWGAATSSLSCTAFLASLPISTDAVIMPPQSATLSPPQATRPIAEVTACRVVA